MSLLRICTVKIHFCRFMLTLLTRSFKAQQNHYWVSPNKYPVADIVRFSKEMS